MVFCNHLAVNTTEVNLLGSGGSRPTAVASVVHLDLVAHSMGSLPGPGGNNLAAITSAVHLDLVVVIQA